MRTKSQIKAEIDSLREKMKRNQDNEGGGGYDKYQDKLCKLAKEWTEAKE